MNLLQISIKRAFTMIELVFVIVVVGIIAAAAIPRYERDLLLECVQQVASHVRYTQHLALIDNKINPNDSQWWKSRWTIQFGNQNLVNFGGQSWRYTIYSDAFNVSAYSGNPNSVDEVARDPKNPGKLLTAGFSGGDSTINNLLNSDLNLGKRYGIVNVAFTGGCRGNGNTSVSFDEKGRPYLKASRDAATNPGAGVITSRCTITLTADTGETAQICIEPETGYVTYGLTASGGCEQFQ